MNSQEIAIYREIQRNADCALKAIAVLSDKVYDEALALMMSKLTIRYTELYNEASKKLVEGKAEYYRTGPLTDALLRTSLQYHTLLNTSTGHIAELLIKENYREILEMEKTIKYNDHAGEGSYSLARQLIETEERSIARLKQYL